MDQWIKDLWNNNKILFFLLIPIVILIFFRRAIIDLLVSDSKRIATETDAKDKDLAQQEAAAKAKADQLVEDAKKLPDSKEPVGEDWYKK